MSGFPHLLRICFTEKCINLLQCSPPTTHEYLWAFIQPLGNYYSNKEAKQRLFFLPQGLNEQFGFAAV